MNHDLSHPEFHGAGTYPLLDALMHRRSRRFAKGLRLDGPLAYQSAQEPQPLSVEEEALLAFAAAGFSGYALAELPYQAGGNIMRQFVARTSASGDALHNYVLFIINDDGAWMLKRPQDFAPDELAARLEEVRTGRIVEWYEQSRVRIADRRVEVAREVPFTLRFNQYDSNVRGSTFFLPVAELTAAYINGMLFTLGKEFGAYPLDDHHGYQPAGISQFARSRGGPLYDDPHDGRAAPLSGIETLLYELATVELGGIVQNLGLMTQALGLGGFSHFAAHPSAWLEALGFRMETVSAARLSGAGAFPSFLARALHRDLAVPTAVGLEVGGQVLIRPYAPPYYANMEQAVRAYLDAKYGAGTGAFRNGGAATGWRDGAAVQAGIPLYAEETVAATMAYCEYVYSRYGRFPALSGPFRTLIAYQAHHLDLEFYERYYRPDALTATQRDHQRVWHASP